MDDSSLKFIGAGLTTLGVLGAALGVGNVFVAMLNGIARNPSAESKLKNYVYIGAAMVEGLGLFALVLGFMILYK